MTVDRRRFSEQADIVNQTQSCLSEDIRESGLGEFDFVLVPTSVESENSGRNFWGLRSLFVRVDPQAGSRFLRTIALHEYVHCWLGVRFLGHIESHDTIVRTWRGDVGDWLRNRLDLQLKLEKDQVKQVTGYLNDRGSLKNSPTIDLARRVFRDYTDRFCRMISSAPRFLLDFDGTRVYLDSDEATLELEANLTLQSEYAGRVASCLLYDMLIDDMLQIVRLHQLRDVSYEEALCYMVSCGITGESLDTMLRVTDRVNVLWAKKLSAIGVRNAIEEILSSENPYVRVRELVHEAISA